MIDYYQDDNRLAQERISGHTIASVSVEFPLPFNMLQQGLTMYDLIYAAA